MTGHGSGSRPADITVDRAAGQMRIVWQDGHVSEYPLRLLRDACPCAECNSLRANEDPLRILPAFGADRYEVQSAELVGHYAMQIVWRDGHKTGIYSWEFLRSLCLCQACRSTSLLPSRAQ